MMGNSIFDALNNGTKQNQPQQMNPVQMNPVQTNPVQMIQQLRQNPAQVLQQGGFTVPDGMADPQQIINHLLQSGQISSGRLNVAQQIAQQMLSKVRR